jgi:O-acetyl-ADP-ribose deacetylase (regulator of RNase III)
MTMSNNRREFYIGNVRLEPVLGKMENVEADALVQSTSPGRNPHYTYLASWAEPADADGSMLNALARHKPFKLGEVIVAPAGNLKAKYLFSAIVIDREEERISGKALDDQIIADTARKCIAIAVALELESIAFTPWGTRAAGAEAAHITAIMLNAITQALEEFSGSLRTVYLVSNKEEHYKWFVDRSFILNVFRGQIEQVRKAIEKLQIPQDQKQNVEQILNNITHNIYVSQLIQGDSIQGDKNQVGNITDSNIAVGRYASVDSDVSNGDNKAEE